MRNTGNAGACASGAPRQVHLWMRGRRYEVARIGEGMNQSSRLRPAGYGGQPSFSSLVLGNGSPPRTLWAIVSHFAKCEPRSIHRPILSAFICVNLRADSSSASICGGALALNPDGTEFRANADPHWPGQKNNWQKNRDTQAVRRRRFVPRFASCRQTGREASFCQPSFCPCRI